MRRYLPLIGLAIIMLPIALTVVWLWSHPSWQLSARNSPNGVVVSVYRSDSAQPTYSTVLTGKSISTEIERLSRQELPAQIGTTTFFDETLRPGRWTLVIAGTKIDIMERALILDGVTELTPRH